jgi:hypothetical protein
MKALALAAAVPQPPSPEIGSVDLVVVEQTVRKNIKRAYWIPLNLS